MKLVILARDALQFMPSWRWIFLILNGAPRRHDMSVSPRLERQNTTVTPAALEVVQQDDWCTPEGPCPWQRRRSSAASA